MLNFGDGDYVHLYENSDDNLEIKAKNINFVVSGNITKNGDSFGDAPDVTFGYSVTKGLFGYDSLASYKTNSDGSYYGIFTVASARYCFFSNATHHIFDGIIINSRYRVNENGIWVYNIPVYTSTANISSGNFGLVKENADETAWTMCNKTNNKIYIDIFYYFQNTQYAEYQY